MSEQMKPCPFCGDVYFSEMDMTFMHADGATKGKRIKCVTCGAQAPDRVWNVREADAALAAKDARIVELEGMLAKALAFTEANTFGGTDALALIKECHAAIAGQQQQPGPATPSEDGGETELAALEQALDEECGRSGNAVPVGVPLYSISLPEIHAAILSAGYVQPAQHSRIVAAKDAEIARLRQHKNDYMEAAEETARALRNEINDHQEEIRRLDALVAELSAQPARQVGGDEPWRDEDLMLVPRALLGAVRYALKNKKDAPNLYDQLGEYCYTARAALAPAAVAVVIPEPCAYRWSWKECRDDDGWGYRGYPTEKGSRHLVNEQALINRDELILLNRRAIPAGLLERFYEANVTPEDFDALGALLGKDGSQ